MTKVGNLLIQYQPDGKFDLFRIGKAGECIRIRTLPSTLRKAYEQAEASLAAGERLWVCDAAMHKMDLTDATIKSLAGFAERIGKLLRSADAKSNKSLVASLDDFLGAIYALVAAHEHGFRGKPGESEFGPIVDRSKQLTQGDVKSFGNWMAGFHFNSALFRISAVFDRLGG